MRLFRCTDCSHLVFFENTSCIRCSAQLAFDPAACVIRTMPATTSGPARCHAGAPGCNWLVTDGTDGRCISCRLTVSPAPKQGSPAYEQWGRLEAAKRRLLYTVLRLELPLTRLRFAFPAKGTTGHGNGLITIILSEADDAVRERRRISLHEPFRTLIGHLRHESGHFFFEQLMLTSPLLATVRAAFGDERSDYAKALAQYYAAGPRADWNSTSISAYATAHPFEDWAETWAHYLHIVDAVELAKAYGLSLAPTTVAHDGLEPAEATTAISHGLTPSDAEFATLISDWLPLTYFANSLNRSLGLHDWYPFMMNQPVIEKMKIIHHAVISWRGRTQNQSQSQTQSAISDPQPIVADGAPA